VLCVLFGIVFCVLCCAVLCCVVLCVLRVLRGVVVCCVVQVLKHLQYIAPTSHNMTMTTLSITPRAFLVQHLLSDSECDDVMVCYGMVCVLCDGVCVV